MLSDVSNAHVASVLKVKEKAKQETSMKQTVRKIMLPSSFWFLLLQP
jgi:hypothetical protein